MALQTQNLVMVGLGVSQDSPPNSIQPPLVNGVHLRWSFPPQLGFPWYGFYLFRRQHRPGIPTFLSSVFGKLPAGPQPTGTLPLPPYGQVSSDQPLVFTDGFPPTGVVELDLDGRTSTRFTLNPEQTARSIQASIGLRSRQGDPPVTRTCIDFSNRSPGPGPNPDVEQEVTFTVFHKDGTPRPATHIQAVPGTGGRITGLICKWSLTIALPAPATYIQATVTPMVSSATIEAFNADGTSAGSVTTQYPRGRAPETLTITGNAITRVVIQPHGEEPDDDDTHDPGNDQVDRTLLNQFCFGTGRLISIEATAFSGDVPVATSRVWGQAGQVVSTSLEFEGISSIAFSADSASLIDLGFVPLTQEATAGWEQVPGFSYPLRLPVTQPAYPCTPGSAENLDAARNLARQRILYGDPKQVTATPTPITSAGTASVVNGSPIVTGSGTSWGANLAGSMFQVKGDATAYLVVQVMSPTKLILSRNYGGVTASGAAYALNADSFGQFYDHLLQLVSGGSAAGSMASRMLPMPVTTAGTVSVNHGAPNVTGSGTNWSAALVGLAFQLTSSDPTLHPATYTIVDVSSPTQLALDRSYQGSSQVGQTYQIIANISGQQASAATGTPPRLVQQRVLDLVMLSTLQPAAAQMTGLYWVDQHAQPGTLYDYLVLADRDGRGQLDPVKMLAAMQQDNFQTLDGCIVFNKQVAPLFPLDAPQDLRVYALPGSSRLTANGTFQDASNNAGLRWDLASMDTGMLLPGRAIMYHLWRAGLGNGPTPATPGAYALLTQNQPVLVPVSQPGSAEVPQRSPAWPPFPLHFIDTALPDGWYSYQVSGVDIFGRHSSNSPASAWYEWAPVPTPRPWYYTDPSGDNLINQIAVCLLSKRVPPPPTRVEASALDLADPTLLRDAAYTAWFATLSPSEQQHTIGLRVRWAWTQAQAQQAPNTSEFRIYYHADRGNLLSGNLSGVFLVGGTGGMESYVQTDIVTSALADAYSGAWLRAGSDSFAIVGSDASAGGPLRLRVRNIGTSTTSGSVSVTNGSAVVNGQNTDWRFTLMGLSFQIAGEQTLYRVKSIDSATQLTLNQPYSGSTGSEKLYTIFDTLPAANAACSIAIPPAYDAGTITLAAGSPVVTGSDSRWNATLVGMPFQVAGEQTLYTVASVTSATQLTLDRAYEGGSAANKLYMIRFPLFVDYRASTSWNERYYVVGFNQHVTLTTDDEGQPLRLYEVLLPAQSDAYRQGVSLTPTSAQPIVYAGIGVSAADNEATTPDDPKWASGRWGNRSGNEGRVGTPATIFRVLRTPPQAPALLAPLDPEHATATAADAQGRSFYTYRWTPAAHLRAHVYRGLDETLFQVDWALRPRASLDPTQSSLFPDPVVEPRWTPALRQRVANELNGLNDFTHDATGSAQALVYYRHLSNDALRVLAGLPGNDRAFSQLTLEPLDPNDPANADRPGPDTPQNYTPNPNIRAYRDTLNGHTANRYLYRALYVDAAHNRSSLSLASVPVLIPDVVAPEAPLVQLALADTSKVRLQWQVVSAPDLARYRIYRAADQASAADVRTMSQVAVVAPMPSSTPGPGEQVPLSVTGQPTWLEYDDAVATAGPWFYRLVAEDTAGNISQASRLLQGRALLAPLALPVWNPPVRGTTSVALSWTHPYDQQLSCLVERRVTGGTLWASVSGWLPRGVYSFTDIPTTLSMGWDYRLRVCNVQGQTASALPIITLPAS